MFKTVFNKLHEHSHTGIKITYITLSQYYYIPFPEQWFPFSYMTVLNVNAINTSTSKSKLLLNNHFQNMLHLSTTAFQWTLKDLLILLHTTNLIYMSYLTLLVTLLLQYPSNLIMLKLQSKPFYTIGLLNLDHPFTLSLIVDQNM